MRRFGGWIVGSMLVLASAGITQPASAYSFGAVPLLNGQVLSFNGLQFSVSGCAMILGGALNDPLGACTLKNLEIIGVAGPGSNIRIQGEDGGNIFSAIGTGSGLTGLYDVTFQLNVTTTLPNTTVNQVSMALTGSVTGTSGTRVSAGAVITGTSADGAMALSMVGPTTGSLSFASDTAFNENKDLKLNAVGAANGSVLVLSYVTQGFLPAPEPISVGVFLVGLAGLGAARRLRRKDAHQPR